MRAEQLNLVEAEAIAMTAEMLFKMKGFENTTIDDITTHLKISESLFFHFFDSLDEVLELLWNGSYRSTKNIS